MPTAKATFEKAYCASYPAAKEVLAEIYDEVLLGQRDPQHHSRRSSLRRFPDG